MKYAKIIFSFFLLFTFTNIVNAKTNADLSLIGNEQVNANSTFTLEIKASNIKGSNLMTAGGKIISSNQDCITLTKLERVATGTANENIFAYSDIDGTQNDFVIAKATFKTSNKSCQANINIEDAKIAFTDSTKIALNDITKQIRVLNGAEIKINIDNVILRKNETVKLNLYVPAYQINANLVSWKSQNSNIVNVDNTGNIKGVKPGTTTIEATYQGKRFISKVQYIEGIKGDLNRDGKVDLMDVMLALRIQMNLTPSSEYYLETGDINNDGRIELTDVLYILRVQMGI